MSDGDLRYIRIIDSGDEDKDSIGTVSSTYLGSTEDEIELRPGMELSLTSQAAPDGYTNEIKDCDPDG